MRDRRPPSNPWSRGTRAANISRQRAILMAFNTPFAISTSLISCITYCSCVSTAGTLHLRWPWHVRRWCSFTAQLLLLLLWQRVHGRDPSTASVLARPTFCPSLLRRLLLSTLVRAVRRDAYVLLCPRGSVPCDVRNTTPTQHRCLLQPLQIFDPREVRDGSSCRGKQVGDGLLGAVAQLEVRQQAGALHEMLQVAGNAHQ
jgi:hypothetical protein